MSVKRIRDRSVEFRKSSRPRAAPDLPAGGQRTAPQSGRSGENPRDCASRASGGRRAAQRPCPRPCPTLPDFGKLSTNLARATEEGQKAAAAYLKPIEQGEPQSELAAHVADCMNTFGAGRGALAQRPEPGAGSAGKAHDRFRRPLGPHAEAHERRGGRAARSCRIPPTSVSPIRAGRNCRSSTSCGKPTSYRAIGRRRSSPRPTISIPPTRKKAAFYVRQITSALSPSNFIGTNPELLYTTVETNGENLAHGMKMLAEDIAAGKGSSQNPAERSDKVPARNQHGGDARQGDLAQRA